MLDEPVCVCSLSCDQAAEGDVAVGPCVLAPAPPAAETPAGPAPWRRLSLLAPPLPTKETPARPAH